MADETVVTVQLTAEVVEGATIDDQGQVTFHEPEFAEAIKELKERLASGGEPAGEEALINFNCRCSRT